MFELFAISPAFLPGLFVCFAPARTAERRSLRLVCGKIDYFRRPAAIYEHRTCFDGSFDLFADH
jgi:hypothetical protein